MRALTESFHFAVRVREDVLQFYGALATTVEVSSRFFYFCVFISCSMIFSFLFFSQDFFENSKHHFLHKSFA